MNPRSRKREGRERGQALTEFALVLPILALLLFGIVQLGIAFNHYITLTDAVRAGARTAAVSRFSADPQATTTAAVRTAAVNLDGSQLSVSASSSWKRGAPVTVSASYPYEVNLLGIVVKSGRLTSTTTERIE